MSMKLLLVFILLTLHMSWQQDSTETINKTLERLIKQTNLVEHSENNNSNSHVKKNNSRIFLLHSLASDKKTANDKSQAKVMSFKTDADNISDIIRALGLEGSKSVDGTDHDVDISKIIKEITLTVEKRTKPITPNADPEEVKLLIEHSMSKGGSLANVDNIPEDDILTFASETENNSLHKYPEIIIDRITYHNDENKNEKEIKTKELFEERDSQATENQNSYPLVLAKELKSLLDEVQRMKVAENANKIELQKTDETRNIPQIQANEIATQQPCRNLLLPYSSPCKSVLLNKLPEYHQHLHDTITRRAEDPHFLTNLQLNRWGAYNAKQNALMRVTRAQKLKRIHFITDLITNMMSRFVYRPLYH